MIIAQDRETWHDQRPTHPNASPPALIQAREGILNLKDALDRAVDDGDTPLANQINAAMEYLEWWAYEVYDQQQAMLSDCHCVLPDQSCPACRLAAVYAEVG